MKSFRMTKMDIQYVHLSIWLVSKCPLRPLPLAFQKTSKALRPINMQSLSRVET